MSENIDTKIATGETVIVKHSTKAFKMSDSLNSAIAAVDCEKSLPLTITLRLADFESLKALVKRIKNKDRSVGQFLFANILYGCEKAEKFLSEKGE